MILIPIITAIVLVGIGILAIISGSQHRSDKRFDNNEKIVRPSRAETQMERYYRQHPLIAHSRICRDCGKTTTAGGAPCTLCGSLNL